MCKITDSIKELAILKKEDMIQLTNTLFREDTKMA